MANGKPKIYTDIEVTAAGGAKGSGTIYTLPVQGEVNVSLEKVTETVEDGQTVINALDAEIDVFTYDLDVLTNASVQDDATITSEAKIWLYGATGVDDVTIDNVRINAFKDYGTTDRIGARVQATKRATSNPIGTS